MFNCKCGFESKSKAGLAAHKRKCKFVAEPIVNEPVEEVNESFTITGENVEEVIEKTIESLKDEEIKTSFDVYNSNGGYIRTFSVEVHGEQAEELAKMFCNKIGGIIK